MKSDIQKIIKPFLEAKNKKNIVKRGRRKPNKTQMSKIQIIQYIKDNEITKLKDITEDGPTIHNIRTQWKSFTEAKKQAFPNKFFSFKPETPQLTAEHIIKAVMSFGLWRRQDYYKAHKEQPEVMPTLYQCTKLFGSWKNTTKAAEKCQFSKQFNKYVNLVDQSKKTPTLKQMEENEINLPLLIQTTHMSREELYQLAKESGQHFKRMKRRIKKTKKKRKKS